MEQETFVTKQYPFVIEAKIEGIEDIINDIDTFINQQCKPLITMVHSAE